MPSPVQDLVSLKTAIDAGADAVYFGIRGFNMRITAKNFTVKDLPKITKAAHEAGIKTYLALNTIIYEEEIDEIRSVLEKAKEAGVDAVICWDLSVIKAAKEIGLETHLSNQASVSNSEAALFYKNLGIIRIKSTFKILDCNFNCRVCHLILHEGNSAYQLTVHDRVDCVRNSIDTGNNNLVGFSGIFYCLISTETSGVVGANDSS